MGKHHNFWLLSMLVGVGLQNVSLLVGHTLVGLLLGLLVLGLLVGMLLGLMMGLLLSEGLSLGLLLGMLLWSLLGLLLPKGLFEWWVVFYLCNGAFLDN